MISYANAGTVGVQHCTIITNRSETRIHADLECLVRILRKTLRKEERSAILEALEVLLKSETLNSSSIKISLMSIESRLKGILKGDEAEYHIRPDLVNIFRPVDAVLTPISGLTLKEENIPSKIWLPASHMAAKSYTF
jgi:hypothetical protein